MKIIDIDNWKRKEHYNFYKRLDYPHYNICANIDITKFHKFIKKNDLPFFITTIYVVSKTANDIKEFRYRIRGENVIEHEKVRPAFTIMGDEELFGFCTVDYFNDFKTFKENTIIEMKKAKENISLKDDPSKDDVLYLTSLPWISFTTASHPISINPVDSIPRIGWGKFFEENGVIKLPLSVQVHHALADGLHVGKYFQLIQEIMDNPEKYL